MALKLNDTTGYTGKDISSSVQLISYTAARDYLVGVRLDIGKGTGLLASAASELTVKAKVTKVGGTADEAYTNVIAKPYGLTTLTHNFDKSVYLQSGEVLTVWVESSNAGDIDIAGDVFILGVRSSGGASIEAYTRTNILAWIKAEFLPLTLATPDDTIYQVIQNAIRYWNTHSGYKMSRVYNYAQGTKRIQLDTDFKTVVKVYPTTTTTWIWNDQPLWTLLGIQVLDNVTTDLIMMSEAFRNYRIYVGTDFRWTFEQSQDPDNEGGWLYIVNVPNKCSSVYVVGTQRVTASDTDIKSEYILDWVLNYAKALLRQIEGNTLRKSDIIGIKNDGQEMVNEGKDEQKELKESLAKDGRWVAMIRRA